MGTMADKTTDKCIILLVLGPYIPLSSVTEIN